jgi:hypothetical protein
MLRFDARESGLDLAARQLAYVQGGEVVMLQFLMNLFVFVASKNY